jgi:hypothetical protein
MGPEVVPAIVLVFISSIVLLMSYLIGTRRQFGLIAGLEVSRVRDSDGLARLVRAWLLGLGTLELLVSLVVFVAPGAIVLLIAGFAALHLAGIAALAIRSQRYLA